MKVRCRSCCCGESSCRSKSQGKERAAERAAFFNSKSEIPRSFVRMGAYPFLTHPQLLNRDCYLPFSEPGFPVPSEGAFGLIFPLFAAVPPVGWTPP